MFGSKFMNRTLIIFCLTVLWILLFAQSPWISDSEIQTLFGYLAGALNSGLHHLTSLFMLEHFDAQQAYTAVTTDNDKTIHDVWVSISQWFSVLFAGLVDAFNKLANSISLGARQLSEYLAHLTSPSELTPHQADIPPHQHSILQTWWAFPFFCIGIGFLYLTSQRRVNTLSRINAQLKAALAKAEAASKTSLQFLANMSHELRTPMNGVLGVSQLVEQETNELSTRENMRVIQSTGDHLITIVNDILDFTKAENHKLTLESTPFTLDQVITPVNAAMTPVAMNKNLCLLIRNDVPDSITFTGDSTRLRQIIFNLVGNAVKFTKQGHVMLQAKLLNDDAHSLQITVTDTGIGIAEEKLDAIFHSYQQASSSTTREFGGTGLGLAIAKRLTELMDGEITVKSTEGLGSSFVITMPLPFETEARAGMAANFNETKRYHGRPLRILIAEDNRLNGLIAQGFCQRLGHRADLAENGRQAADMARDIGYDVILMDNNMPEMDGVQTTRYIREQLQLSMPIFAYTADVYEDTLSDFMQAGADHILAKPLQIHCFDEALSQFADRFDQDRKASGS